MYTYLVEELLDLADDPAHPVEALVGEAAALELAEAVLEEGEGGAVEVVLHAVRADPLQRVHGRPRPAQRLHPVLPLELAEGLH